MLDDVVDHPLAVSGVGNVASEDREGIVSAGELGLELLGTFAMRRVTRGDGGSLGGKAAGNRSADAAGTAGDDSDATNQLIAGRSAANW
jgi:hypothetical protein